MVAATTHKSDRGFDYYGTAPWFTEQLLKHHPITSLDKEVFECCNGQGLITKVLREHWLDVLTNDLNSDMLAASHLDMTRRESWEQILAEQVDEISFTITNPPYNAADQIIPLAYEYSTIGIAMLLRCTWMESTMTGHKAKWLAEHPPTQIISLPRFAFSKSKRSGKWGTDSCPTWWFIWRKDGLRPDKPIVVVPYQDIPGFFRKPTEA